MNHNDLCRQLELREKRPNHKDNLIAKEVLLKYLEVINEKELPHKMTGNYVEGLLYNNFLIKGTKNEKYFLELLELYKFNYSMSIHNAIYYLLATQKEYVENINPLSWPGVKRLINLVLNII